MDGNEEKASKSKENFDKAFRKPKDQFGVWKQRLYLKKKGFIFATDAGRYSLASLFPKGALSLLSHLRTGPLLPGCVWVPRHGRAVRPHRGHRGLHRYETRVQTFCVCVFVWGGWEALDGSLLPLDLREPGK